MDSPSLRSQNRGFILLLVIAFSVVAVVGYIVIKRVLESDQAQEVQNTADQVIDTIDQAKDGAQKAGELIDRITP